MLQYVSEDNPEFFANRSAQSLSWLLSNGTEFATGDLPFVHYFMRQFPSDRWFAQLAQPISEFLVQQSARHDVLQHATISVAALLASTDPDGQPEPTQACMRKYLEHKQIALQLLQKRINSLDISPYLSAAVAFLLMGEMGGPHSKVHMQGLKSVLEYLQNITGSNEYLLYGDYDDSRLIWLSLAVGMRLDITLAAVEGDPVLDPLPITPEMEKMHKSWIQGICETSPHAPQAIEWGFIIFTLRGMLHRVFHIASLARRLRNSPDYSPEKEATIQMLCLELELELERWFQRPLIQDCIFEEKTEHPVRPSLGCFLHYEPFGIRNFGFHNLMSEYRTAVLYLSIIAHPQIGPGPPGSKRFSHAVDLCRSLASDPFFWQWSLLHRSRVTEGARLFQLFLCCLTFGGDEFYPLETREALNMFVQSIPEAWGCKAEEIINTWIRQCPGLPPVAAFSTMKLDEFGEARMNLNMFVKKRPPYFDYTAPSEGQVWYNKDRLSRVGFYHV